MTAVEEKKRWRFKCYIRYYDTGKSKIYQIFGCANWWMPNLVKTTLMVYRKRFLWILVSWTNWNILFHTEYYIHFTVLWFCPTLVMEYLTFKSGLLERFPTVITEVIVTEVIFLRLLICIRLKLGCLCLNILLVIFLVLLTIISQNVPTLTTTQQDMSMILIWQKIQLK